MLNIPPKILRIAVPALLSIWLFLFLCQKIDLQRGDLGRYLKEGELLVREGQFVTTNTYSYVHPDFAFPNHDWASSPTFYLMHKGLGFAGMQLLTILLTLSWFLALILFLQEWEKIKPWLLLFLGIFLVPVIGTRTEMAPEIFTALFSTAYFLLIWGYLSGKVGARWLWLLPVLMLFWVNLHVYFMLGWVFLAGGMLQMWMKKGDAKAGEEASQKMKRLSIIAAVTVLAALVNPGFFAGLLTPFRLMAADSAFIAEEAHNLFGAYLQNHHPVALLSIVMILMLIGAFKFSWPRRKDHHFWFLALTGGFFALTGLLTVGNIGLTAMIALPLFAINLSFGLGAEPRQQLKAWAVTWKSPIPLLFIILPLFFFSAVSNPFRAEMGLGVHADAMKSVEFFKQNGLKGPIFNNYGNASYLIWGLYPQEQVYTLNKWETYPNNFWETEYFPALLETDRWEQTANLYDVNVIFFKLQDEPLEHLRWLGNRLGDGNWAMVYHELDKEAILLRRTPEK